jgi:3-mercaptopyruvate sulfurtransferase SseA
MEGTISSAELARRLGDPYLTVVDVRPMAAFNGWRLQGEARGGHIPGAIACPSSWLDSGDAEQQRQLLAAKGITPDREIVVYGTHAQDSAAVVSRLRALGYRSTRSYEAGAAAWAADARLPLDRLYHYQKLVHAEWVHRLCNGEEAETYAGSGFAIFHVNHGDPQEYAAGHLPGAVYLDTDVLESPTNWNRRPAAELAEALQAYGITQDKTIVLYGSDSPPAATGAQPWRCSGQMAAARAAAILMYAGVQDVRLLDGGLWAWRSAGYELDRQEHRPAPGPAFGIPIPGQPDILIDLDGAESLLVEPTGLLVSIQSWDEYVGKVSGYTYIPHKGRIAGAVWGNSGDGAHGMQHYRNVDNTMRAYTEIEAGWRTMGITPDKRVAFYCGTGWRASEAFFYAHLMGWRNISVYDGGWFEWSTARPQRIETGPPE